MRWRFGSEVGIRKVRDCGACKSRTRSTSSSHSSASIPSETVSQLDGIASAPAIRQESSSAVGIDDTTRSDSGTLQNQDVMLELRKLCRTRREALLLKEKECEAERKDIAHLSAVIELLQGSSATSI